MTQLINNNPNQGWVGDSNTHDILNINLNSQNVAGNYSNLSAWVSVYHTGGYTETGIFNGQQWVGGVLAVNNNWGSGTIGATETTISSWSGNQGHDANGNLTVYMEYYVNQPATSMTRRGANWTLPRIPLAPTFLAITADTIKPTSARLGAELSSLGHGTSCTFEMFYRLQGSGTWISLGQQADVGGYNYWSVTGLKPGKVYEYTSNLWNNNGDSTSSGTQTFKTKAVAGIGPLLMQLI